MNSRFTRLKARTLELFPEGLTGVFSPGGTRTSYILEHNRDKESPGEIDLQDYVNDSLDKSRYYIRLFFDAGIQNLIFNSFSIQGLYERGNDYSKVMVDSLYRLIDDEMQTFYHKHDIDPYLAGVDILRHLPQNTRPYQFSVAYDTFHQSWSYQTGRRKLIWETAPIPLFSFWQAHNVMGAEAQRTMEVQVAQETNLEAVYRILYTYYARAAYGTDVPMPHFYLASNRNGDIKPRTMLPFSLLCGGPMRMYSVPYPSYFMTEKALIFMLEDLVNDKRFRSFDADYRGKMTPDFADKMYTYFKHLADDPATTVGLSKNILDVVTNHGSEE